MGQYWKLANLDKKEFVHPYGVGAGLKLWEQLAAHPGTGAALIVLCAAMPYPRGGGDLRAQTGEKVIGRWAGDRVALVGDYAEREDLADEHRAEDIYARCSDCWDGEGERYKDITALVAPVIEQELDGTFTGDTWKDWKENNPDT